MIRFSGRIVFIAVFLLLLSACGSKQEPSDSSPKTMAGGNFNKFFPSKSGDFDVVFVQEKSGFAEAKLKKAGNEVATLSIADIAGRSNAADKFNSSSMSVAGYPAAESGSQGTAVLVGNRFQVQVRSKEDGFTADHRRQWLEKFDLRGLERLR